MHLQTLHLPRVVQSWPGKSQRHFPPWLCQRTGVQNSRSVGCSEMVMIKKLWLMGSLPISTSAAFHGRMDVRISRWCIADLVDRTPGRAIFVKIFSLLPLIEWWLSWNRYKGAWPIKSRWKMAKVLKLHMDTHNCRREKGKFPWKYGCFGILAFASKFRRVQWAH